jgi:hypothetical protein
MTQEWLPPEIRMTSMWTELLEYCDWDEEAVALLIEQVRHDIPPKPAENIRQLVIDMMQIALKEDTAVQIAES